MDGYLQTGIVPDSGKRRTHPIHRMVLIAFRGEKPPGMVARHLNGNRLDNRLENLIWGTPKENSDDREDHGRTARGDACGTAKLTERDVEIIRLIDREWRVSANQIGKLFGVDGSQVRRIILGEEWRHTPIEKERGM